MTTLPIVIRAIRPEDKQALRDGTDRLSERSRYRRFLSPHGSLTPAELTYFTEVDHHDHEALVAIDPITGEGIGVARYIRSPVDPNAAELAVAVADDWQHHGVGTRLTEALAHRARQEGIARFTALLFADNTPMLHLIKSLGVVHDMSVHQGIVELTVELPPDGVGGIAHLLRATAAGELHAAGHPGPGRSLRALSDARRATAPHCIPGDDQYEPGETKDDPALASQLAELADAYVNDAFGTAHRAHASTEGVAHLLPRAAGRLMQREVGVLSAIVQDPPRPLVAILGGAKVSDKIGVIERFLALADAVCIGGAMAFPFLAAQGHPVGASRCADADLEPARRALAAAAAPRCRLLLPEDLRISDSDQASATSRALDGVDVPDGFSGLDIGPRTAALYADEIAKAATVFWNGPMGRFELEPFAAGTRTIADAVARASATTVVGGGETVAAMRSFGLADQVTHLSTGGGATLELLEGRELPGVQALLRTATPTATATAA